MYRVALSVIIVIILVLICQFIYNMENFSINLNDPMILNKIAENNKVERQKRKDSRSRQQAYNRYSTLQDMERTVNEYTEKINSVKEILQSEMPICRHIDLHPNIDYKSDTLTRDTERFTDPHDIPSGSLGVNSPDKEVTIFGKKFGLCSNYFNPPGQVWNTEPLTEEDKQHNESLKNKCKIDPYCDFKDKDKTTGVPLEVPICEYKKLNHMCVNSSGNPIQYYLEPGILDNI